MNAQGKSKERTAMTAQQLEIERILANVADLPIGKTLTLPDIAHDGFGGMVVKRHSRNTVIFQREGSKERSRWADSLSDACEEIEVYVNTGKLHEPDSYGF